uniref:Uncharacterized protein n=1 Tax=Cacopsylla melanoneura TaxID=428564 RepID=A0A8D8Z0U9_9HEMI
MVPIAIHRNLRIPNSTEKLVQCTTCTVAHDIKLARKRQNSRLSTRNQHELHYCTYQNKLETVLGTNQIRTKRKAQKSVTMTNSISRNIELYSFREAHIPLRNGKL